MHSLPPSLTPEAHYAVSGNVSIDPSAAIAPGSLLLAESGCALTIGAGVCVGAGSVIHVFGGDQVLATGAILGSAVLLVGSGSIGEYACVGAMSTLINATIQPRQGIPQESYVFGETRLDFPGPADAAEGNGNRFSPNAHAEDARSSKGGSANIFHTAHSPESFESSSTLPSPAFGPMPFQPAAGRRVYGLEAYYRLMAMLFPQRDFTMVATSPLQSSSEQAHSLTPQEGKDGQAW